jgi:hypothetical protein
MRAFEELGRALEARWHDASYDELAFPSIAADALREANIPARVDANDLLAWCLSTTELPEQDDLDGKFGEPPITMYRGRRFFVQVLFWLTSTTCIHRHSFSGAFQVLQGSSLHSRYEFQARRRVSSQLLIGDVRLQSAELLERGDVVPIMRQLAHGLFHLQAPSVTIVVRTFVESEAHPQYRYDPPHIAIDPFFKEQVQTRWLQALEVALRVARPRYEALAVDLVSRADLHTAFLVLRQAYLAIGAERSAPLLAAAERHHGAVVTELAATLEEDLRRRRISQLRGSVFDAEQRFFLALAQNLPNRDAMYALIRQRHPHDDPRTRVLAWARTLSGVDTIGINLHDELNAHLFEALVDGCSDAQIFEQLRTEYGAEEVERRADSLTRHVSRMKRTVLAPLFRGA